MVGTDEVEQAGECGGESGDKLIGRGVLAAEFFENFARSLAGLEFVGHLGEVLLVPVHVGVTDFEELRERQVDHFVVQQFL